MLTTKADEDAPLVVAAVVGEVPQAASAQHEAKLTSLRRAATVLLAAAFLNGHHLGGWVAAAAAVLILCASPPQLMCRSRCARRLCVVAATLAAFSVITQLGLMYLKAPQRAGLAALEVCDSMPAVTFAWVKVRGGGHHHMDEASDADRALLSDQDYNLLSAPVAAPELDAKFQQEALLEVKVEQQESCAKLSHCVIMLGSLMLFTSTLASLALFLAALNCYRVSPSDQLGPAVAAKAIA